MPMRSSLLEGSRMWQVVMTNFCFSRFTPLGPAAMVCDQTIEGRNLRDKCLVTQKLETPSDDSLGRAGR